MGWCTHYRMRILHPMTVEFVPWVDESVSPYFSHGRIDNLKIPTMNIFGWLLYLIFILGIRPHFIWGIWGFQLVRPTKPQASLRWLCMDSNYLTCQLDTKFISAICMCLRMETPHFTVKIWIPMSWWARWSSCSPMKAPVFCSLFCGSSTLRAIRSAWSFFFFFGTEPAVERKRNKRRFKHPQMMVRKGLIHKCSLFSIFSKCGTILICPEIRFSVCQVGILRVLHKLPIWKRIHKFQSLVGSFKHEFYFLFHIWDVILPIDELIFFKMVKTTNQIW